MHEDRTRMERDVELIELNPYQGEPGAEDSEYRWRSLYEIQEWVYEQGYNARDDQLWQLLPTEIIKEIGMEHVKEGPDCANMLVDEHINECIEVITEEELSTYVDGQMRLYARYDVAENGDTLEEGDYHVWEDLRGKWELGVYDKLKGNRKYKSL